MWEIKDDFDGKVNYSNPHDSDNIYSWYDSNPATNGGNAGTPLDGMDTEDFINALNTAKSGGFSDWRLPTTKELGYIADLGTSFPAINTFLDISSNNTQSAYWFYYLSGLY